MSAIWVILLDTSGSMAENFHQASSEPSPLDEAGPWPSKLDAAKDLLLRQVSSLRVQDIAVLRFTDSFEKIFQGSRDELLSQPDLIRNLKAAGGTSIAAALDGVRLDRALLRYRSISVLVLSDGLSDQEPAEQAANALITEYPFARIDTILIDETADGRKVAESISLNGTVRTATSSIQLGSAISAARAESLRGELSSMPMLRYQAQSELASGRLSAPPTLLKLASEYSLTAGTLRNDVAPTIGGIESVGRAVSDVARTEYRGSVSSISQDSPISINLTGLKESVDLVLSFIIPWRRRHAERLSYLEVRKQEIEVERHQRDLGAHDLEIEHRRLQILKDQLDLANARWDLAESVLPQLEVEGAFSR